jgi:magnesium chelatase subunit I
VGLFNILEEHDVQIRGYPVSFDIDVVVLFQPTGDITTGGGDPAAEGRIGTTVVTHYPRNAMGIEITQRARWSNPGSSLLLCRGLWLR